MRPAIHGRSTGLGPIVRCLVWKAETLEVPLASVARRLARRHFNNLEISAPLLLGPPLRTVRIPESYSGFHI